MKSANNRVSGIALYIPKPFQLHLMPHSIRALSISPFPLEHSESLTVRPLLDLTGEDAYISGATISLQIISIAVAAEGQPPQTLLRLPTTLPSVPFTPASASDNCGENLGSFSYWFSFVSKSAPLAHMKITRTGFMDAPVGTSGQRPACVVI